MKKEDLIPPDPKRCQGEKPNGNNFMTLGGVPGMVRCENIPAVIATEKIKKDGVRGSMSLCTECLCVMTKQCGGDFATLEPINKEIVSNVRSERKTKRI